MRRLLFNLNSRVNNTFKRKTVRLTKLIFYCLSTSIWLLFVLSNCTSPKNKQYNLTDLNLLRGEITLCGSGDFGEVDFALSCKVDVQETFNLAISLLHSFEYTEAEKAFVQVIDIDPECAMAYWGVAMSNFHSLWLQSGSDYLVKGSRIIEASKSLKTTQKESDYLYAISGFYQDWETVSHAERVALFEKRMKKVYTKYQEDKEAAIFYALALRASADPTDKSYKNQRESGRILQSIYPNQPNHPGIAHYLIHNYDYPELAELALPTARSYAQIAPSSAHAQHMPSHIFTRLGLWQESINSNLQSTAAALCYSESIDPTGHWDEELHGMDYLVYAYLQIGDTQKAMEQYEYLKTFKNVFPANFKVAYAAAAIPARIALETRNWSAASNLELPDVGVNWEEFPWQRSIIHFARAMGSVRSGAIPQAKKELRFLQSNQQKLLSIKDRYKAKQVEIQIKIIEAWITFREGSQDEALRLMQEAVTMEYGTAKHPVTPGEVLPAAELYGELLMEAGRASEALEVFEGELLQHPNRFSGLFGAGMAAKKIGNHDKASRYLEMLVSQCENTPVDRKEIMLANNYLL